MSLVVTVEEQEIIERAVTLQDDLERARLYKTMHKMKEVTRSMGWELADRAIVRHERRGGEQDGKA